MRASSSSAATPELLSSAPRVERVEMRCDQDHFVRASGTHELSFYVDRRVRLITVAQQLDLVIQRFECALHQLACSPGRRQERYACQHRRWVRVRVSLHERETCRAISANDAESAGTLVEQLRVAAEHSTSQEQQANA